ncbi:reverse transcriptase domain-containing protein [Tanacetum coccineum]
MESKKKTRSVGTDRVTVIDGRPLKSILKKPRDVSHATSKVGGVSKTVAAGIPDVVATAKAINKSFAAIVGSDTLSIDGKYKVRRKGSMNPFAMVWEVEETDFSSLIRRADMKNVAVEDVEKVVQDDIDQNVHVGVSHSVNIQLMDCYSMDSHVVEDTTVVDKGTYVDSNNGSEPQPETRKFKFRTLINEEKVECVDCVLPRVATKVVKGRYDNSIVGFFVGKDLAFPVIQNYVTNTWSKFGLQKLMRSDDGVYVFKFSSKSGMEQVLERGPWMIRMLPIILNKWSFSLSLKKGEVTKVSVWVKLHNVSLLAYSKDGLSLIATQIGKHIMLDAFTYSMCVETWGRIGFDRALIEVSSDSDLKKEVIMAIPNEDDTEYVKEVIRVEYEWKPPHCLACKRFGHSPTTCQNRVKEDIHKAPSMSANKHSPMEDQEECFVEIKGRKKKGKARSNQHRRISGIKLSKPNPNFQYRPVSKIGKERGDASKFRAKGLQKGFYFPSSSAKTLFGRI